MKRFLYPVRHCESNIRRNCPGVMREGMLGHVFAPMHYILATLCRPKSGITTIAPPMSTDRVTGHPSLRTWFPESGQRAYRSKPVEFNLGP